jgi:ribose transport system permease protein
LNQPVQQQAEQPAQGVSAPAPSSSRADLRRWLVRLAPVLGLVIVIVAFALVNPAPDQYLSVRNLRIVLAQTVIVALASIGMTIIIVSGGIDLSVGSTIALSGVVTAVLLRGGAAPMVAVAAGVVVGGLIGIINGLVITRLKVMPFIATLGMLGVARGVAKWMADQQTVNVPSTWINELAVTFPTPSWLLVAPGVWLTALLAVAAAIMLRNTVFGRRVFAIGSNEGAARACGVPTDRLKVWIYGLAGLLVGLSGVTQMSRLRQGDPTVAIGSELDVIAAVVIGGASLNGGEGSIAGAMIGALTMAFLRNGSQQMGWPNYIQEIMIGIIIVLAVAIDRVRRTRFAA